MNSVTRENYFQERISHWNNVAKQNFGTWSKYHHTYLEWLFQHIVAPGKHVLEIGCGAGELLNSVKPSKGAGVDFSERMVEKAKGNCYLPLQEISECKAGIMSFCGCTCTRNQ